jgi:hypothetical protein
MVGGLVAIALGCDESHKRSEGDNDRRRYTNVGTGVGAREESIVICCVGVGSKIVSVWLGYDRIPPVEGRSKRVRDGKTSSDAARSVH